MRLKIRQTGCKHDKWLVSDSIASGRISVTCMACGKKRSGFKTYEAANKAMKKMRASR